MSTDPTRTHRPLSESEADAAAQQIIANLAQQWAEPPAIPTSYVNREPLPQYGTTLPVAQPDSRIVPQWATGVAVASIGVGAGVTGLGCGVWLALQGLASITLASVLFVTLPIAALAAAIVAVGSVAKAVKEARREEHYHYSGPVHQENTTQITRQKWFGKTTING